MLIIDRLSGVDCFTKTSRHDDVTQYADFGNTNALSSIVCSVTIVTYTAVDLWHIQVCL